MFFFLGQFQETLDAAKFPENLQLVILKSKIAGFDKQILVNDPELRKELDYGNFKKKLRKQFKYYKSLAESQGVFINAKQLPTQSTEKFHITAQKYFAISGHAATAKQFLKTMKLTKFP